MKTISKQILTSMAAVMALGIAGCSTTKEEPTPPPAPEPVVEPQPEPAAAPAPMPAPEPVMAPKPDRG